MSNNSKFINGLKLILWIIIVEVIGGLSGLLAGNIQDKYNSLQLPPLSPPDYVFGPVWTFLYLLIGVSGYLIVRNKHDRHLKNTNLGLFIAQLFLNFIWSLVFFGGNSYWIGLIIIITLDIVVIWCIFSFKKVNKVASLLLIPYLIWILFATYLTLGVAILN